MKTKMIPLSDIKFIKSISFEVQLLGDSCYAKIVYMRNPSETYWMDSSKRTVVDEMMCFFSEECYPKDNIDDIIFKSVQNRYPSARISTELIVWDAELVSIQRELSCYSKASFCINIQPRIDDINSLVRSGKTEWRVFIKTLPLYILNSSTSNFFKYEGSFLYYDLDKEDALIELEPQLLNEVITF